MGPLLIKPAGRLLFYSGPDNHPSAILLDNKWPSMVVFPMVAGRSRDVNKKSKRTLNIIVSC